MNLLTQIKIILMLKESLTNELSNKKINCDDKILYFG